MARPDFGMHHMTVQFPDGPAVEFSCGYVLPGLTMQDLMRAFSAGKAEAKPGDEYAGNPGKWPEMRGLNAVLEAVLTAVYGPANDTPSEATLDSVAPGA